MADWLVAQVSHQGHLVASKHLKRIGLESHYPLCRRTYGRPQRTEVRALFPGYMFVRSPVKWYCIVECSSEIFGIVAKSSDLEPLRSRALDAYVEDLIKRRDRDGFLPAPPKRSKFLRGDKVYVSSPAFEGLASFFKQRGDDGAEVSLANGLKVVVWQEWLSAA